MKASTSGEGGTSPCSRLSKRLSPERRTARSEQNSLLPRRLLHRYHPPVEYGRRRRGMAAHGAVTARRRSITRLKPGFRTQPLASRRERTEDSPTRWRFRLPSPGTFRLQPCGGPRTAFGPGFNLIALRGRRSRDSRPSLRPGQEFAERACRSLRRYRSAGAAPRGRRPRQGSDGL
jgi:hypothetical protein